MLTLGLSTIAAGEIAVDVDHIRTRELDFAALPAAVPQSATLSTTSSSRRGVVGLLVLLFAITYLDRVCISVAGPRMQEDLGMGAALWLNVDASREIGGDSPARLMDVADSKFAAMTSAMGTSKSTAIGFQECPLRASWCPSCFRGQRRSFDSLLWVGYIAGR